MAEPRLKQFCFNYTFLRERVSVENIDVIKYECLNRFNPLNWKESVTLARETHNFNEETHFLS